MKLQIKKWLILLGTSLTIVVGSVVLASVPALAQTTSAQTTGIGMRIVQIIVLLGLVASIGGLSYGLVIWRNASQNNDILGIDRGRRLSIIFLISFSVFAILLLVVFLIGRSSSRQSSVPTTIVPTGSQGLQTKDALLLIDSLPVGEVAIRNIVVRLAFNQSVSAPKVTEAITIKRTSDQELVAGEWEVKDTVAMFKPSQICPDPNADLRCFDQNQQYTVSISNTLTSVDGDQFTCASANRECVFEFTTGSLVDSIDPSINLLLPAEGQSVAVDSSELVEALAKDDTAVSLVEFFVDDILLGVATPSEDGLVTEFRASSSWNTGDLLIGSTHSLQARVTDLAGAIGISSSREIEILPAYCFDGQKNEDETGVDCGGPNCKACSSAACTVNSDCASGLCFDGVCRAYPVIQDVIDDNGAVGNIVTIRGANFGAGLGRVIFLGGPDNGDEVEAEFPDCELVWSNDQVIVQIPEGALSGPIRLETSDNFFDITNDNKGVKLNFEVNLTVRPGLCQAVPGSQVVGQSVDLYGKGLGSEVGKVLFGNVYANQIGAWSSVKISQIVLPFLDAGKTAIQVSVDGVKSNPVFVTVLPSPTLPRLSSIAPSNGPVGQIISVSGENIDSNCLVKFYNPETGQETLADTRLPEQCKNQFTQSQLAIRVPRVVTGDYQVYLQCKAGDSNKVSFDVTEGERIPGLCSIDPDNGPTGLEVTFHGEGFGNQPGIVRFSPRVDGAEIISWTNASVTAIVPVAAQTGDVQIISSEDKVSNPLSFSIGQCSPDTCGNGFECCASGACQKSGTCSVSVALCTYDWLFSTGADLGGPPRVIEQSTCEESTQSPSPYKGSRDACLNGAISARFTHDMKDSTLSASNIVLRKCNSGGNFNSGSCQTTLGLSSFRIINQGQSGEGFTALPENRLESDTWYQVTLADGITAENGLALQQSYTWSFKTQVGQGDCSISKVQVTPAKAQINQLGEQQVYTGVATALNCNILDANKFSWKWLSENTAKAIVTETDKSQTRATAKGATEPGPPVKIIGEIPSAGLQDEGLLTVSLKAPIITDKFPNCSSACLNAVIGAQFDQDMQQNSLTQAGNIELFGCSDATCSRAALTQVPVINIQYNQASSQVFFAAGGAGLVANTTYRVVIKDARSQSGIALGSLNYDSSGDSKLDSYSWIFTVKDGRSCDIESISVIPLQTEVFLIGADVGYMSFPKTAPDACAADGQLLQANGFSWRWDAKNLAIATITAVDINPKDGQVDNMQLATTVGSGETIIEATTQSAKGEATLKVTCGFESDEQCPAPATVETYGVGVDSCCYERPRVLSTNPQNGADAVCTTPLIQVQFSQKMNESSIRENLVLEKNNGTQACVGTQTTTFLNKVKEFALGLWNMVIPSTSAQAEQWCKVDSSITVFSSREGSYAQIKPKEQLTPETGYRIRVLGDADLSDDIVAGVKTSFDVAFNGSSSFAFTTGQQECKIDYVEISIAPPGEPQLFDALFCAVRNDCPGDANSTKDGNQHAYTATARDISGVAVDAEYAWLFEGDPILTFNEAAGQIFEVSAEPTNGEGTISVIAKGVSPVKGEASRTIDVFTFICENPWPSILTFPFVDQKYNFNTFYCRDFGEPGFEDDLPPLSDPVEPVQPVIDSGAGQILQEKLFIVQP